MKRDQNDVTRVHVEDIGAPDVLASSLAHVIGASKTVFVCVGTDRSTGDAFGPLIGSALKQLDRPNLHIYGTLEDPIHAVNLDQRLDEIHQQHSRDMLIAIDACLGRPHNVGSISLRRGPLRPGTGVRKDLTPVGNFHLVGVVNVAGMMEFFVLQNTRLSLVMRMVKVVTQATSLLRPPLVLEAKTRTTVTARS